LATLLAGLVTTGCGPSLPQQSIEIKVVASPIERAKAILKQYENGQLMSSEASGFDALVQEVSKQDPAKGELLKKGLNDLKGAGPALPAKAKELAAKL
jgi:hypothetical protein